jgi:hypothetical protein
MEAAVVRAKAPAGDIQPEKDARNLLPECTVRCSSAPFPRSHGKKRTDWPAIDFGPQGDVGTHAQILEEHIANRSERKPVKWAVVGDGEVRRDHLGKGIAFAVFAAGYTFELAQ